jgi:hypothetical protein
MEEDNLDLEAADRFLLRALEDADEAVRQRALLVLRHETGVYRDETLNAETQRAENNARRAEEQRKRADEAEREVALRQDQVNKAD